MKINKIIKWGTVSIGTLGLLGVPLITVACGSTKYTRYSFPNQPRVGFWYGYKQNDATTLNKIKNFFEYVYDHFPIQERYLKLGLEWPKITNIGLKPYERHWGQEEIMEDRWINYKFNSIDLIDESPDEILYSNLDKSTGWLLPVEITFDTGKTTTLCLVTHAFSYTRALDLDTLIWSKNTDEEQNASVMNKFSLITRKSQPWKNEWAKDEWIFYEGDKNNLEPFFYLLFWGHFTEAYKKDMHDENNRDYRFFNPVNMWYMIMLGNSKNWDDFLGILDYSEYLNSEQFLPANWRELVQP